MADTQTPAAAHINGQPLTTGLTGQLSPDLLRSHVDKRIARIRPSSTPLDQISRMVGCRNSGSMKVDYYSVDTKPSQTVLSDSFAGKTVPNGTPVKIATAHNDWFSETDTFMVKGISTDGRPMVFYVSAVADDGISAIPLADASLSQVSIPSMPEGTEVVRMGRAAGELDVQTPQYNLLPVKDYNYCQIFKAQIEESTLQRLADKEVGWNFSDQEESAIADMRLGIEKSFLFGSRCRLGRPGKEDVYTTGGIWSQAGREYTYPAGAFSQADLTELMRKAFTGGAGSPRKVLLGGSEFMAALMGLEATRVVSGTGKKVVWGIDFDCITSKFGTLYVKLSEIFDLCGMSGCGMVIDPEYITKYAHIPFTADRISFHKQGVRNTEAVVLTEASCLVLRYPGAHMRIMAE